MASVTPADARHLGMIAMRCSTLDPKWAERLKDMSTAQIAEEIRGCSDHLKKLASEVKEVLAIVFPNVQFKQEGLPPLDRKIIVTAYEDKAGFRVMKIKEDDFWVQPLDRCPVFFVLHKNKLSEVVLNPDAQKYTDYPSDPPLELTPQQLEMMKHKRWNACFVSTDPFAVIPFKPSLSDSTQPTHEGKTSDHG